MEGFALQMSIIVLLEQLNVMILETKIGQFLIDSRIFSENNPPRLIESHIFILNQLHKNT